MLPSVLLLDDEEEVLSALVRVLRKDYRIYKFTDPLKALDFYKHTPTHIVISDMRMPKMDGGTFLSEIAKSNDKSKRIALTGHADIDLAQQAINEGHISYYLNKPWNNQELLDKLALLVDELKRENLQRNKLKLLLADNKKLSEKIRAVDLLQSVSSEQTEDLNHKLTQLKQMNADMLHLMANLVAHASGDTWGHGQRIAAQAKVLMRRMQADESEISAAYVIGLLQRIGIPSLPNEISNALWFHMSVYQRQQYDHYFQNSQQILSSSPFLKPFADVVGSITENVDGSGTPRKISGKQIPIAARVLRILIDFDLLVSGKITGKVVPPNEAISLLKEDIAEKYDRHVFEQFVSMMTCLSSDDDYQIPKLVSALENGMIVASDIIDPHQHKLLSENTLINERHIDKLTEIQGGMNDILLIYIHANWPTLGKYSENGGAE
ncbi:HD domain-containing phosphohydrolase [Thalassotalea euphylliae]|uniref:HD domain-containing phosphohydrolase n=1 Tax=Thalassotalea euphylliae TaxID=1655234 RepID=UPI0036350581